MSNVGEVTINPGMPSTVALFLKQVVSFYLIQCTKASVPGGQDALVHSSLFLGSRAAVANSEARVKPSAAGCA